MRYAFEFIVLKNEITLKIRFNSFCFKRFFFKNLIISKKLEGNKNNVDKNNIDKEFQSKVSETVRITYMYSPKI